MTRVTIDHLRAVPVADALARTGAEPRSSRWGPCPACGEDSRRGPVWLGDRVWRCVRCQTQADSVATAALLATGSTDPHDWREVCRWASESGWVQGDATASRPRTDARVQVHGLLPPLPWLEAASLTPPDGTVVDSLTRLVASQAVQAGMDPSEARSGALRLVGARLTARRRWERHGPPRGPLSLAAWRMDHTTDQVVEVPRRWTLASALRNAKPTGLCADFVAVPDGSC